MSAVPARDVTVAFGAVRVFDRLSLDVEQGEFLVLLGPSGCWQVDAAHAIGGLLEVETGQIWIGFRNVTWEEPKDRGIAGVFQLYEGGGSQGAWTPVDATRRTQPWNSKDRLPS